MIIFNFILGYIMLFKSTIYNIEAKLVFKFITFLNKILI